MLLQPDEDLDWNLRDRKAVREAQPIMLIVAIADNGMGWKKDIKWHFDAAKCFELTALL
ncbi:hypothetical protein ANO14919_024030 [Xylariales sp. No.14919]|nr:hypothetical protein ANO14919_024030 [Xylariales sp. No.14919]